MFLISCSVHWPRALPSHLSYKTSQQSKIFQRDSAHEVTKTITAQAWQLHPSLSTIKYRTRAHSLLMVHSKHTNTAYHPRNLTQRPGSDHSRGGGRCSSDWRSCLGTSTSSSGWTARPRSVGTRNSSPATKTPNTHREKARIWSTTKTNQWVPKLSPTAAFRCRNAKNPEMAAPD